MQILWPLALLLEILEYFCIMNFKYLSQKYLNICIRSTIKYICICIQSKIWSWLSSHLYLCEKEHSEYIRICIWSRKKYSLCFDIMNYVYAWISWYYKSTALNYVFRKLGLNPIYLRESPFKYLRPCLLCFLMEGFVSLCATCFIQSEQQARIQPLFHWPSCNLVQQAALQLAEKTPLEILYMRA